MITHLEVIEWGLGYAVVAHFPEESELDTDYLAQRDSQEEAIAYATPLMVTLNIQGDLVLPA